MAAFSAPEPRAVPPPPARRRPRRPPAGVEAAADAAGAGEQELHLQPQGQGGAHDHIRLRRRQLRQELRRRPPALLRLRRSRQASRSTSLSDFRWLLFPSSSILCVVLGVVGATLVSKFHCTDGMTESCLSKCGRCVALPCGCGYLSINPPCLNCYYHTRILVYVN